MTVASADLALINSPLGLPNGSTISNRLAKGAMSEFMGDSRNRVTPALETLYARFAQARLGLMLTGNVQIDRRHLEDGANVVIDGAQDAEHMAALRRWSAVAKSGGSQIWMQLSHSGRQVQKVINPAPKAPSAVALNLPGKMFGMPVAMNTSEVEELVSRFAEAAAIARDAGFNGVELHGAHGYLFSQFLSPLSNRRDDKWGGDLRGRARFLLLTVEAVRDRIGSEMALGVKLNSADFQRGGFSAEDSQIVAGWLDEAGVDLIEISGGNYEQPKMTGMDAGGPADEPLVSKSTKAREAYFSQFAPAIRERLKRAKLMVTGGFKTVAGMADAIRNDGIDLIGLARPLSLYPEMPAAMLGGKVAAFPAWEDRVRLGPGVLGPTSSIRMIKAINGFGAVAWYNEQLLRLGRGDDPNPRMSFLSALVQGRKRQQEAAASLTHRAVEGA